MRIDISNRIGTTSNFGGFRGLLDKFSGAAAGYSLRKLSKSATNAVRVRRSSDNTEQDIGFTGTDLDTTTLLDFVNARDVAPADYGAGAAAAYSLRYVSDSYTGAVVRVRRDSDNAEADFTPSEITDGTLLSWVGNTASDNGHVTTWYDQSGNSNDASQATAASQPKIVDAGVLVEENGKVAVDFDGSNNLTIPSSTSKFNFLHNGSNAAVVVVGSLVENNANFGIVLNNGRTTSKTGYVLQFEDRISVGASRRIKSAATKSVSGQFVFDNETSDNAIDNDTQFLIFNVIDADNATAADRSELYIDEGSSVKNNTATNAPSTSDATNDLSFFDSITGKSQEIIIYNSDQSSNRGNIEANVNDYYSIYTSTNDGFVTTWYDQAGSNDATQATAASQPQIVDGGSLITENGKVALQFDGSDDYLEPTITGFQSIANLSSFTLITPDNAAAADDVGFTGWNFGKVGGGGCLTFNGNTGLLSAETFCLFFETGVAGGTNIKRLGSSTYIRASNIQSVFSAFNLSIGTEVYAQGQAVTLDLTKNMSTSTASAPVNTTYITDDKLQIGAAYVDSQGGPYLFTPLKYQELIFYPSDQSGNRTAIEGNINGHYNIYP